MKERTIVVPDSYFTLKSDWALAATEKNEPAAELINTFLFHRENPTANRMLVELVQRAIRRHKGGDLMDLAGFQPYSLAYLRELLLETHGQNQIVEAIKILEKLNFLTIEPPQEVREFYSKTHSWYKIEVDVIWSWIGAVWMPANKTNPYHPKQIELKRVVANITGTGSAEMPELKKPKTPVKYDKQIDIICGFDKHIHGRNGNFVYDPERKSFIRSRIVEGYSLGQLAQGVIGLLYSDWHNGAHPDNMDGIRGPRGMGKKFLEPEYIFKTGMRHLDKRIKNAEDNGVTLEIAQHELAEFMDGKDSKYSARVRKVEAAAKQRETGKAPDMPPGERRKYKEFAFAISRFFITNVDNKEILEMCDTNVALKNHGKGLVDVAVLTETIIEQINLQKPATDEVKRQAEEFAKLFCGIQELMPND